MPGPANAAPTAPTAPVEFLGVDLISLGAHDHLSGAEATDVRLLLVEDRGEAISVDSWFGEKCVSMKERRKRLALSRGPASFSVKYDLLVVRRF